MVNQNDFNFEFNFDFNDEKYLTLLQKLLNQVSHLPGFLLEGGKPQEEDSALNPEESIIEAVSDKCPDIILFLCKAKEVDSAVQESLEIFARIIEKIHANHGYNPPIIGIVTQCDELDPSDIIKPQEYDKEKYQNIARAVEVLDRHLKSRLILNVIKIVPTTAKFYFREDGTPEERRDYRWNIDYLAELLVEKLPKGPDLAFARLARVRKFQKKAAIEIVNLCSAACGAVGATPIPIADLPILLLIQTAMVVVIGFIAGRELSFETAREFLLTLGINVGGGFVVRQVVRGLVGLFPGFGTVIKGGTAFAATKALGLAAIEYFIDGSSANDVKQKFDNEFKNLSELDGKELC